MNIRPRSAKSVSFSLIPRGGCFRFEGCVYQKVTCGGANIYRGHDDVLGEIYGIELTSGIGYTFDMALSVEPVEGTFVEE